MGVVSLGPLDFTAEHEEKRSMNSTDQASCQGPLQEVDRVVAIDVLRGFALLGILVMNMKTFAMIGAAYFFPTAYGDLGGANLVVWWLADLLANRKFMTIFSLLFGAGVILQTARFDAAGRSFRGIYYRRLFWLWVFGLIHSYVFWEGDILVTYAIAGLLLYPMRKMRARTLMIIGLIVLVVGSAIMLSSGLAAPHWDEHQKAEFIADWQPDQQAVAEEEAAFRGSWLTEIKFRYPRVLEMHLFVIPYYLFWRAFGVMLMGMAMFKWGLLGGQRTKTYRVWIVLGLLVGLPLSAWGAARQFASGWEPITAFMVDSQFGYWGSLPVTLGLMGLVFLTIGSGRLSGLKTRLAAVGRMALTNYLLQTVLCTFIFFGRGLGLFGSVSRVQQMGIVLLVWLFQLWISPWWLARYNFGPMEWLWRLLSYGKRPPFRR
jgi:uncharacterized protein